MTWTVKTRYTYDEAYAWCQDCDFRLKGTDVRLTALQHTKQTGHTTSFGRDIIEEIEPGKEEA